MRFERWLYIIPLRLRSLLRRNRVESDLDEELRYHQERSIQQDMAEGMTLQEAQRRALRAMDSIEARKEECRDIRHMNIIENLKQDLRYAIRTLRRSPAFTAVAILSLALGIGANATVFTFVNAIFLRTLPVPQPHQLVQITAEHNGENALISFPMFRDLRDRQQVFTGVYASAGETLRRITTESGEELDGLRVSNVTANYFDVLGVQPAAGRFFRSEEDRDRGTAETAGSVIVLSDSFWDRQFGRNPDILNKTILVGRIRCVVIGIAPEGFFGDVLGKAPAGWLPLIPFFTDDDLENRRETFTLNTARLKSGIHTAQAETAMTALFQQLLTDEGLVKKGLVSELRIKLIPADIGLDSGLRQTYTKPLWIIMAVVGFVLLIACSNLANLMLARANSRRGEIGIRLAIGCSRPRLVCQLLTESVLLSLLGAAAGALFARWGSQMMVRLVETAPGTIRLDLNPDINVFAFLVAAALLTGVGFGIVPALRATRLNVAVRGQAGTFGRQRLSRGLIAGQVALSLVLLVGSGLLIRSFRNLHQVDLGFRPENVLVFDLSHTPSGNEPLGQVADRLWQRVRQVQGIESVSLSGILIFSASDIGSQVTIDGERVAARYNSVSPDYFETLGMDLLEGRGIGIQDGANAQMVAVINESMAQKNFRGGAVGQVMSFSGGPNKGKPVQIVGVIKDSKYNNLREGTLPMFYVPITQVPRTMRSIEVRTHEPVAAIAPKIRLAVSESTKDVMIRRVVSLSEQVDQSLTAERLIMRLCSFFGGLALLLACVGIYGVVSYGVAQRTNEIGVRMTLGATRHSVIWMVLRETLLIVFLGTILGIGISLTSTRLLKAFLYGLSPTDTATIGFATALLITAAVVAAVLPARRASKVDPLVALRYE